MKKDETSQTQTVIDYLTDNKIETITIRDLWETFPLIKRNTMSTLISRDLKKKGLITPTGKRKGMSVIYRFDPNGKPASKAKRVVTKLRKGVHKKAETDDPYVRVGKAIETLLEEKNQTIQGLTNQLKAAKQMILDHEATIQDRDRHIMDQGEKIHELSEKVRKKSGGAIKLDELQSVLNG